MFSVHLLLSAFILLCPFLRFALSCLLTLSDPVFRIYWFLPFGLQGAIICHWSMVSSPVLVYLELRSATFSITKKHALAKIYLQRHRFWVVNNVIFDTPQLQRKIRTSRPMQLPNYISVPSAPSLVACENIHFSSLFVAGDFSRGGTSATQRQKFHTDDANQCLHNKSGSHGVPNVNLSNFACLLVDFGKVLCWSAHELQ